MKQPREVAESYWRAECTRDVEAVLEHYAEHATFTAPGWQLSGHDEVRKYYESSVQAFPGVEVKIVGEVSEADRGAFEWQAVLIDDQGQRFPLRGVNIIEVRDGRFTAVRAYFDPSGLPGWGA